MDLAIRFNLQQIHMIKYCAIFNMYFQMEIEMSRIIMALFFSVSALLSNANNVSRTSSNQILIQLSTDVKHSGGTDRNGCHQDHETGTRHCH